MYVADCACMSVCFKCEKASKESGLIHVLSVEVMISSTSVGRCGHNRDILHRRVGRSPSLPSLSMAKKNTRGKHHRSSLEPIIEIDDLDTLARLFSWSRVSVQ
jgi:hypothetical protein